MQLYIGAFITKDTQLEPIDLIESALGRPMVDDDTGEENWAYFESWKYETPYLNKVLEGSPYEYALLRSLDHQRAQAEIDGAGPPPVYFVISEKGMSQEHDKLPAPTSEGPDWHICLIEFEEYS